MSRPDQQRAMHSIGGDGIGGAELPARKDRLDDLESMGNPVQAGHQGGFVHLGSRCMRETKDDLRLDPRLAQSAQRQRGRIAEVAHGRIVHVTPNRRVYLVFLPNGAVGEADLSAYPPFAACFALAVDKSGDAIGFVELQSRWPGREGHCLAARRNGPQDFIRDSLEIGCHDGSLRSRLR
jgi:hypothetical protein